MPLDSAVSQDASLTANSAPPAPVRPDWVSDEYFDPAKGVKLDELGAKFKELTTFKQELDAQSEARKADMPANAREYGILPEGAKLPEGYNLDPEHPMWGLLQDISFEKGLTKKEYGEVATKFVERSIDANKAFVARAEAQRNEMFKQLGDNGAQRIDAVNKFFVSAFGEKTAAQMSQTLFTPDIVKGWEQVQKALTSQGTVSFNGLGRDGAGGGDIEGWDKMTFEQRWASRAQQDRRAS